MSDEELIARLRNAVNGEHDMTPHGADVLQAADRIEELLAERKKAVETLKFYAYGHITPPSWQYAHKTLAEIKGESHD